MSITLKNTNWERSIKEVVNSQWRIQQTMGFEVLEDGEEQFRKLPEKMESYLRSFMKLHFLFGKQPNTLRYEYDQRRKKGKTYWPQFLSQRPGSLGERGYVGDRVGRGGDRGGRAKHRYVREATATMDRGFSRLWDTIAQEPLTSSTSTSATVGIGRMSEIKQLRLNEYMGTTGSLKTTSNLNSLFYAIEFGTGIAENVGAEWVRHEGPTKDSKIPGAWWFKSPHNEEAGSDGALFLGQKGFHFLYDERRQRPKQMYADYFHRHFPKFVQQKLAGIRVRSTANA